MHTVLDTIGSTPLFRLQRLARPGEGQVLVKWERSNPGGSIKDRPAHFIVTEAERRGLLKPGGTIIESSSGNFGISLAMIGAAKGYRVIILVDPKTTPTNLAVLKTFGAEVVVVTELDDCGSYHKTRIALANKLAREIPGAFRPDQCFNLMNSEAHYQNTARELLAESGHQIDVVIAPVSTGGQLGGLSRYLKRYAPHVQVVGVDAIGSIVFGGKPHSYLTPGVGLGWTPENLDLSLIDAAFKVPDEDAFLACRLLARCEGVMPGASSGATLMVALHYAQLCSPDTRIVCMFADGGERYLQTIYADEWMQERNLATSITVDELRARALRLPLFSERPVGSYRPDLAATLDVPETTHRLNAELRARQNLRLVERPAVRPGQPMLAQMAS
ncbi:MAG TPA: cysteine synthase family protein [Roseiflexaceae bacterium]|nr:cysteine synthase family protein [Roseiflexaceae bacterium]